MSVTPNLCYDETEPRSIHSPDRTKFGASLVAQTVKCLPAMPETRVPRSGRSPGEGNGNPLLYSCLENSMDGRSLVGYSPWCRKKSDTTEQLHIYVYLSMLFDFFISITLNTC